MSRKSEPRSARPSLTIEIGMSKAKRSLPAAEEEIRQLLVQTRRRAGLSQVTLAERLGVPQSRISRWESGDRVPGATTFLAWMRICNATSEELGLESTTPDYAEVVADLSDWFLKLPPWDGPEEERMSFRQARMALEMTPQGLYYRMEKGAIQGYRHGRNTVFRMSDIAALKLKG